MGQDWAGPKGHDKGVRWLLGEGGGMRKVEAGNQLITCAFFFFFSSLRLSQKEWIETSLTSVGESWKVSFWQ